ncbi:MAG: type II secretion system protein [Candidatus Brocadiia bacterium]
MNSPTVRSRRAPPRARAMTLTEIIVVMAIMAILVSAVVVAVFRISSKGPVEGTKGLLEKLAVGLEAYRATYRMYPEYPQPPAGVALDAPQVQASSAVLWQSLEFDGDFVSVASQYKVEVSAYNTGVSPYFVGAFVEPKTNHWSSYYYQDAWLRPIQYLCNSPYTQYSLTSGGPDLLLGTADDITVP